MNRAQRRAGLTKAQPQTGGQEKTIAVYYEGQNAQGAPDHYIAREKAEQLKTAGDARPIHKGKAILVRRSLRNKPSWNGTPGRGLLTLVVAGQTPKSFGSNLPFPGFPHIEFR